ncbi:hypothetical protein cyc_07711 [Cyclospora cayetanensis]|uniref:Uncharacterized protein n=1 Tax=Cyclospora cayetanensis TaxID=88456 RepID=A0A1D3D0L7_9EIME|nr:hypothetical protein cyc_07711 [Cyclospora cayetanensis]
MKAASAEASSLEALGDAAMEEPFKEFQEELKVSETSGEVHTASEGPSQRAVSTFWCLGSSILESLSHSDALFGVPSQTSNNAEDQRRPSLKGNRRSSSYPRRAVTFRETVRVAEVPKVKTHRIPAIPLTCEVTSIPQQQQEEQQQGAHCCCQPSDDELQSPPTWTPLPY